MKDPPVSASYLLRVCHAQESWLAKKRRGPSFDAMNLSGLELPDSFVPLASMPIWQVWIGKNFPPMMATYASPSYFANVFLLIMNMRMGRPMLLIRRVGFCSICESGAGDGPMTNRSGPRNSDRPISVISTRRGDRIARRNGARDGKEANTRSCGGIPSVCRSGSFISGNASTGFRGNTQVF